MYNLCMYTIHNIVINISYLAGIPQKECFGTSRRKTRFSFVMTNRDVREKIKELFPRVISFDLARRSWRAKLKILPLDIIPAEFKAVLKSSALYVLPRSLEPLPVTATWLFVCDLVLMEFFFTASRSKVIVVEDDK